MKSKFALSFGIALIFIGLVNFLFETNNIILFGISLSAFIFSILSILFSTKLSEKKWDFLYIIPLIILMLFLCYSDDLMKFEIVKQIVNSQLTSALTFISFGISFVSEYLTEKKNKLQERLKHSILLQENLRYTNLLRKITLNYFCELEKNKIIIDESSKKYIDNMLLLFDENDKEADIIHELLSIKTDEYTIDNIKEAYVNNTEIFHVKVPPEPKKQKKKNKKKK